MPISCRSSIKFSVRNNLWDWQSLQPTSGPKAQFYQFCDALEVKDGQNAPATGWGLDHALAAWGSYFKNTYYSRICGTASAEDCLGTYDVTLPYWTDISVNNAWRSWFWIVCNEVGYLQEGAPRGHPTIATRLVQPEYDLRQCQQMFPAAFTKPPKVQTERTNRVYKGWDVKLNRLFFGNGIRDPWKDATVSATRAHVGSTPQQPIAVGDGFHCSDLGTASGIADPTVRAVQLQALGYMKIWLATWKPSPEPQTGITIQANEAPAEKQVVLDVNVKPINAFVKGAGIA